MGFMYYLGLLLGCVISGAVIGLIPFITGIKRHNKSEGLRRLLICILIQTLGTLLLLSDLENKASTVAGIITLIYAIIVARKIV